jgi:hypothetical protein
MQVQGPEETQATTSFAKFRYLRFRPGYFKGAQKVRDSEGDERISVGPKDKRNEHKTEHKIRNKKATL